MDRSMTKVAHPTLPLWIPHYKEPGQPDSVTYDTSHTTIFLEECTKYFQSKSDFKHIFLLDGTPVFNLDEIPESHRYIAVSIRPFLREKRVL